MRADWGGAGISITAIWQAAKTTRHLLLWVRTLQLSLATLMTSDKAGVQVPPARPPALLLLFLPSQHKPSDTAAVKNSLLQAEREQVVDSDT
jgi:hypothetical protein